MIGFNPRTHTGCDDAVAKLVQYDSTFQSTHPHGVRRRYSSMTKRGDPFQSTHPHGVRLRMAFLHAQIRQVSIHAPTRGATHEYISAAAREEFQSTHPHGVRPPQVRPFQVRYTGFNPRTHTGCDNVKQGQYSPRKSFNPRTHTGCDSVQSYIL